MSRFVDLTVSAVVLAGIYATTAYGLGLIYGVLRVVNLAHGGAIMAGAYVSWVIFAQLGIDPYLSIPAVLVFSFLLGVALYRGLVRRLPRGAAGGPASLLLLFGVWLVLRNIAYLVFSGNDQTILTSYSLRSLAIGSVHAPLTRFVVLAISRAIAVGLHFLLRRTMMGRAIRAVAQNPDSCTLVGISVERIYMLTFGIGTALAGVAGALLATMFSFNPTLGTPELLRSFAVVVLGGLGSIYGVLIAALIVAGAESYAVYIVPPYVTNAVGYLLLVVVLVVRPGGLFGQRVLA